ncbi:hypothetical protein BH11PSE12_BH11PSE12_17630 [soil metagenome]
MKKIVLSLSLGLAFISGAYAENRRFPTDILHQGEVDLNALINHQTDSYSINSGTNSGSQSSKYTGEAVSVRYGLGSNWHIGVALSYFSQAIVATDFINPPYHFVSTSSEGRQNPSFSARYGFINDEQSSLSLSGGVNVTPNMTGHPSTYTASLSGGWQVSKTLKLYSQLSESTSSASNAAASSGLNVGAYNDISENVTLIPTLGYSRSQATNTSSSITQTSIGLSSQIQVCRNTYLIPAMSFSRHSAVDYTSGYHRDASSNGKILTLNAYHLF